MPARRLRSTTRTDHPPGGTGTAAVAVTEETAAEAQAQVEVEVEAEAEHSARAQTGADEDVAPDRDSTFSDAFLAAQLEAVAISQDRGAVPPGR